MTPVERATVATLASLARRWTAHDRYLSGVQVQILSDGTLFADALDPRREYPVERASLRGAVALATWRREPWHTRLCEAMYAAWLDVARWEESVTGTQRHHPDAFAWAEATEDGYCPTFADAAAVLNATRDRMMADLPPLSYADAFAVASAVLWRWGLSLSLTGGEWVATSLHVQSRRFLERRGATANEAAEGLLCALPLRMSVSDALTLTSIPGAP
jgi:hypothetical protein